MARGRRLGAQAPGSPFAKIRFKHALEAAGLPDIRFHDLRHTATALLLQVDGRIIVAQLRLGHQSPTTTTHFYGHALPGDREPPLNGHRRPFSATTRPSQPSARSGRVAKRQQEARLGNSPEAGRSFNRLLL